MQWQENCIILSIKTFSENARIVSLFNETLGRTAGLVRGLKTPIQQGDISDVLWKGRLAEQLGTLKVENIFSPFPYLINNPLGVSMIDSACTLCVNGLPEKAPHPNLFNVMKSLFMSVNNGHWLANYALFELAFLSEVGAGLDFSKCAVTGAKENLCFVSPRTGRAVIREVGEKYKDKLFSLPKFLIGEDDKPQLTDIFSALKITGHFLKMFFYGINNRELPLSRDYLLTELDSRIEDRANESQHNH
ncbi:MAG: DNA repair protein RecO [Alphaproteobacteria bacterium]|nr:DNA repair protein RecO [Alphaproteobacteria bacterium]